MNPSTYSQQLYKLWLLWTTTSFNKTPFTNSLSGSKVAVETKCGSGNNFMFYALSIRRNDDHCKSKTKTLINQISYFFPFTDFSIAEHCCFWIDIFSFSCFFRMVSNSFCCLRPIFWKAFSFFSDSRLISSNSKTSENTNVCYKWQIMRQWVSLNKEKNPGEKSLFQW